MSYWKSAGVIGDLHYPYHRQDNIDLALEYFKANSCDRLVLLGDVIDCYELSKFSKAPDRPSFLDECQYTRERLTEIKEAFGTRKKIEYIEGNHEERLARYIRDNAGAFYGYGPLTISNMLGLPSLKIEYISNKKRMTKGQSPFTIGKVVLFHGSEISPGSLVNAPRALYIKLGGQPVIFGHYHQQLHYRHKKLDGTYDEAVMMGTMGNLVNEDFSQVNQWVAGMCIVHYNTRNHHYFVDSKVIIDGRIQ